jgi:hypothetical protein
MRDISNHDEIEDLSLKPIYSNLGDYDELKKYFNTNGYDKTLYGRINSTLLPNGFYCITQKITDIIEMFNQIADEFINHEASDGIIYMSIHILSDDQTKQKNVFFECSTKKLVKKDILGITPESILKYNKIGISSWYKFNIDTNLYKKYDENEHVLVDDVWVISI